MSWVITWVIIGVLLWIIGHWYFSKDNPLGCIFGWALLGPIMIIVYICDYIFVKRSNKE